MDNAASWSKDKLSAELEKGYADMHAGRSKPAALYFSELKEKIKQGLSNLELPHQ
ncbi:MAG: hypothetical protein J6U20_06405 [Fibrobacter sp.]|nr:hypothetical protein [Fibrobacter sp.]